MTDDYTVTVTVTEALVLRPLLEDRGRITELLRILVPEDRMKQKCFQITTKQVRRSQQFQLHRQPVRQRVRGTTRLPHDDDYSGSVEA